MRVQNYNPSADEARSRAGGAGGVAHRAGRAEVRGAGARRTGAATVHVTIPASWSRPRPRFAIAADVVRDGKYLGQITEAVVDLKGHVQF